MYRPISSLIALLTVAALAACAGDMPTPTPDATTSSAPTRDATPAGSPTAAPTEAAGPEPTADGGSAFTCDLPIVEPGSVTIANIADVRVGTHDGYDRLVFEFEQGTPEFTLDRAEPPFAEDGSGFPVEVPGDRFLGLVMRGGTKQTDAGTSSYAGPTEFATGFPMLVAAVEAGDFERQSTWILGLADDACVRVLLLDEPPRLVIDVER
jgi:predicted small lipoprotein YifL